jgi:DNA-binding NtrC family response regulator
VGELLKEQLEMRIYLCGEELVIIHTLSEFLTDLGHNTSYVFSEDHLLNFFFEQCPDPDVIVLDLGISKASRTDLLQKVNTRFPEIPIIVICDYGSQPNPDDAMSRGVHAYLRKPVSLGELEIILLRLAERLSEKGRLTPCEAAESDMQEEAS